MISLPELEEYFSSVELPNSMRLDQCTVISDVKTFVSSNISYLKSNPGNKRFMPYYNQLVTIKNILESNT